MKYFLYTLPLFGFVQCATTGPQTAGLPVRNLAWVDGNVQTNYEPDRKVAQAKVSEAEKSVTENSDVESQLEYLSALSAGGKSADAEAKIKKFLVKYPTEKRGVFILAVHYMRNKKKELAAHFFNELEQDKTLAWKSLLYNNLGMLALQEKNRRGAIEYFDKATKSEPPTAAPLVNLGALYLQSRSYREANGLFERAIGIDDQMEDAWLGLGASLEGQGKFEEAHNAYSRYMQSNPNALSVVYNDSIILGNRLKKRTEAAELMLRYIQRGGKETAKAHEIIQSWR